LVQKGGACWRKRAGREKDVGEGDTAHNQRDDHKSSEGGKKGGRD